jgi:hypothetical protein
MILPKMERFKKKKKLKAKMKKTKTKKLKEKIHKYFHHIYILFCIKLLM